MADCLRRKSIFILLKMLAANGPGLSAVLIFVILQPEPLLSKVNEDDILFCCSALFVQLGLELVAIKRSGYILQTA